MSRAISNGREEKFPDTAAVGQAGAECGLRHDVSVRKKIDARTLALLHRELALEQLTSVADRACRIARDQIQRTARREFVAAACADLLLQ